MYSGFFGDASGKIMNIEFRLMFERVEYTLCYNETQF